MAQLRGVAQPTDVAELQLEAELTNVAQLRGVSQPTAVWQSYNWGVAQLNLPAAN